MNNNMFRKVVTCLFVLVLLTTLGSLSSAQERDTKTIPEANIVQVEEGNEGVVGVASGDPLYAGKALGDDGSGFMLAASTGIDRFTGKAKDLAELPAATMSTPARPPVLADGDGDGLSDSLQAKLADALPTDLVDVIVSFSGPGNADSAQHAVGPFHVKREFRIISGFAATMTAAQAKAMSRAPGVFRVEEDFKVSTTLDAANHDFGTESARQGFGVTGNGVCICVVDTGVDTSHEQLDDGKVIGFVDYVNGHTTTYDDNGHGTHVSSIAAGDGIGGVNADGFKGVAPGASIYAVKVLDSSGYGDASDVIAGIQWCAGFSDINIISMSLAAAGSSDGTDSLCQAVDAAVDQGKVIVVGAGNAGAGPYTIGSPGAAQKAITVGGVAEWSAPVGYANHSEGIYLAPFSSRGPTADDRTKPDIVAPGVSITAAQAGSGNGYATYSGTSMATPFISGTVALALEGDPPLTPADVKNMLMSMAQDRGPVGLDNDWGAGLLDGYAFVAEALGYSVEPTPFPTYQPVSGIVSDYGEWTWPFEIAQDDLDIPIGITITIDDVKCILTLFGTCLLWDGPDLDAELIDPNDNKIAESLCPDGSNECGGARQETLHAMPTVAGSYTVRVYPWDGIGGSFILDVSTGPLAAVSNDQCPDDPNKTEPGMCGCGTPDTDTDQDGTPDCNDNCPNDPAKTELGVCGCGVADTDTDSDGTLDCNDGCPDDPNKTEPGVCGCGVAEEDCNAPCGDGYCAGEANGEDCKNCSMDCIGQEGGGTCDACFKGQCDGRCQPSKEGPDCADCASSYCCGDGVCEGAENESNCAVDCGQPASTETDCADGVDNDSDGFTDCGDPDCSSDPACSSGSCDNDGICEEVEDCKSCPGDCDGKLTGKPSGRYCCGDGIVDPPEEDGRCGTNP